MWTYITALIFGSLLVSLAVYYARKSAKDSARLEAIKRELKERERANQIIDTVRNMDEHDVRQRLCELARKVKR